MKSIKKIIIITLVIIVIIIAIILILKNDMVHIINSNILSQNEDLPEDEEISVKQVDTKTKFYTVEACTQKYISFLSKNLNSDNKNEESSEDIGINTEDEKKQAIYNLLDKKYIEDNEINIKNIYDFVPDNEEESLFEAVKINAIEKDKVSIYSVYGKLKNLKNKNNYVYKYYIVTIDNVNKAFMIKEINVKDYPDKEKQNLNENANEISEIGQNENNKVTYLKINDVDMAQKYFNKFKEDLIYDPEEIYNFLDNEYRNKRFVTLEKFKEYVSKNLENLKKLYFSKFLVNRDNENYTEYVCKDQYDNVYIFKEKNVMEYTIMLDTYTLEQNNFSDEYNKVDDIKKVQMNIDKFFQMINRQDYDTSYNCLSKNFANNYLETRDKFEIFARNEFFKYNKISFNNYEKKGDKLYIFNLEISDLTGESKDVKNIKIIMQLNDNMDFEMSFGV